MLEHDIGSQGVSRLCSERVSLVSSTQTYRVICNKTRLNRASEFNSYCNIHCGIISSSKIKTLGK